MKKRVCFCIENLGRGGAERVMSNLANKFYKHGYEVFFLCTNHADKEYKLLKGIKLLFLCDVLRLSKYSYITEIQQALFLRKFLRKNKIDVGIAFMGRSNFALLLATLFTKTRRIISVRNTPEKEYPAILHSFFCMLLFPTASRIVFQTEEQKEYFSERIQKLGTIIYNPVSDKFYHNNENKCGNNIVTVGRLVPQKNQKMLIDAFKSIKNEYPYIKLQIYGDGELRQELEEYIKALNMRDCISLHNAVIDIERHINTAKMFVMTSQNEGMPNALMEAMALGLPVISTDCRGGGPRELIKHKYNGLLVKSQAELEESMKLILNAPHYGKFLGTNAKKTADIFHESKIFRIWESIVNEN